jgi:hypothetical protein
MRQMHKAMSKDEVEIRRLRDEIYSLRPELGQDDKSDPRD